MPTILFRELCICILTLGTAICSTILFMTHTMAHMTPQFNQRPRRSLMNHDPDEADNEEMNRLRSGFRATIATKWHITKDQLRLAQTKKIFMITILHLVMIPKFLISELWSHFYEEYLINTLIVAIPNSKITQAGIHGITMIITFLRYLIRDSQSKTKRRTRREHLFAQNGPPRTQSTWCTDHWCCNPSTIVPIPKRWMVLSSVQLQQSYVGMLQRMGVVFPSDPFALQHNAQKAVESFIKVKSRCDKRVSERVLWWCNRLAIGSMLMHFLILRTFAPIIPKHTMGKGANSQAIAMMTTHRNRSMALSHLIDEDEEDPSINFSASNEPAEFGLDTCATHHICVNRSLFTEISVPEKSIGVQGVAGSLEAEGRGTVMFVVNDDDGKRHNITLHDVILLPSAPKNLISISRWSKDLQDDCAVFSRGKHSVFMWGHDEFRKTVHHPPECSIPLMPVNTDSSALTLFVNSHRSAFIDEESPEISQEKSNQGMLGARSVDDKQLSITPTISIPPTIDTGDIVKISRGNKQIVARISKRFRTGNNSVRYKAIPIDTTKEVTIQDSDVQFVYPDPAETPTSPTDIDQSSIANFLTKDDLKQLWSPRSDDTMAETSRITLYWHHRLRCAPLCHLKGLAKRGVIPKCIASVKRMPLCASCAFAAAHRRQWRTKNKTKRHIRKPWQNEPGDGTSCDHIVSHQPGIIPQATGRPTHERFWGSVIYVDHATDFIYNHLIRGTSSEETLESKLAYERTALSYGVRIGAYHADNSRFNDSRFTGSCCEAGQQITFCGVGAHHQNALAESKIKAVCYGGRTILLHAKRRWPSVITTALWPFAIQAIVDRHNRLSLDGNGKSPLEKFSKTDDEIRPEDFHTWGCPVFVLAAQNQSGAIGTPKWEPRARAGVYLGRSPSHAGNVALVLNLETGLVSPQYHVVFDDEFTTVQYLASLTPPPNWSKLVQKYREVSTDFKDDHLNMRWLYPTSVPPSDFELSKTTKLYEGAEEPSCPPTHSTNSSSDQSKIKPSEGAHNLTSDGTHLIDTPSRITTDTSSVLQIPQGVRGEEPTHFPSPNLETLGLRRSARIQALKEKPVYTFLTMVRSNILNGTNDIKSAATACFLTRKANYEAFLTLNFDGTPNNPSPLAQAFYASQANNEVYTLKEMLLQPDKKEFFKAMQAEVQSMFDGDIWEVVPRSEMESHYAAKRAKGQDVKREQIMMIWSFKRKRNPDGTLTKFKARLCCHGGQQQWGLNYWDTYAPVVSWSSIRILLTLSKLHGMYTKSIDFVQAYPQAKIKTTIFLRPPQGIELSEGDKQSVLKLKRNLYGLKDAGRTWFEHLSDGLRDMGFSATISDPCIFIRDTNIIVLYVDDCIVISKSNEDANKIHAELQQRGFKTTDEGTLEQYLGLKIEQNKQTFRVTQPMLIDRIIASVPSMKDAKSAKSPAVTGQVLTKDDGGEPRKESWNYRSVVGMLNYLVTCTHPELSFAVHQCARFCSAPKRSHEQAIKRIIRYLINTKRNNSQGIIYRPDKTRCIDVYVDASFAGEWNEAWSEDSSSVMSRTGFTIMYAGCPVVWASKL